MPLEPTTVSWLSVAALVLAAVAVLVALAAWRRAGSWPGGRTRRSAAPRTARGRRSPTTPLTSDQVTAEIEALQVSTASALRHLAVVRYDAFGDMGGHLSWSMALLDDGGDGVVVSSIHGRSDSRTYAKNVTSWSANQQLSPEEEEAIGFARASHA